MFNNMPLLYKTVRRPRNPKFLALTGVSIYPLSLLGGRQAFISDMGFTPAYGSFSSRTTQAIPAGTTTLLTYDRTDVASRIALVGTLPTERIQVQDTGVYRLLYSVQLNHTGGGLGDTTIFTRVNTTPAPNTGTYTVIRAAEELVMTAEFLLSLNANDVVSVCASSITPGNEASAITGGVGIPDSPSIVTIIQRIA